MTTAAKPTKTPVLVTGAAGFIGYHLARRLLENGQPVVGFDSLNAYYDVTLKEARLRELRTLPGFVFQRGDLADRAAVDRAFETAAPRVVLHMAAQAGVRYSLTNPDSYVASNLVGFHNMIEAARLARIDHFLYASSSSVYGANVVQPFATDRPADHPVSLYAATKRSNELVAHCMSHLHGLPTTGLRFFTVYGPWGRPDMALFKFTQAILAGEPIEIYNDGNMRRDFTYIDDVVDGVLALLDKAPVPTAPVPGRDPPLDGGWAPAKIYNVGRSKPEDLMHVVSLLETALGKVAQKVMKPLQPGDVLDTYADVSPLADSVGYAPKVDIKDGIRLFVDWYRTYYGNGPRP
ncbi:MAG: NAD-dependent epimerase/dehydratase family protein [Hyphomicrobiales bacterium]